MNNIYRPVQGKTYTLFGENQDTDIYYSSIKNIIDNCLTFGYSETELFKLIKKARFKKSFYFKSLKSVIDNQLFSFLNSSFENHLYTYTLQTKEHLKHFSFSQLWDRKVRTTELQYHYYMLEIELINRINKLIFLNCQYKIALLPHCLRDFSYECKSAMSDIDYVCTGCQKNCFINRVVILLKKHNIKPYIWKTISIKKLGKEIKTEKTKTGILGVACIPELIWGLRYCSGKNIPAVGIPLNANRCIRWMGDYFDNSASLEQMEKLIK